MDTAVKEADIAPVRQFRTATVINAIVKLREQASKDHQQYELGGRKALHKVMAAIYKNYVETIDNDKSKQLAQELRAKLTELNKTADPQIKFTEKTDVSSLLIRYVFEHPDDKQVSIYAKALRVNAKNKVKPDDFIKVAEAQPGGYSGFKEDKAGGSTRPKLTAATGLSVVEQLDTTETINLDWNEAEEFRVFVAVRGDDDEAELKAVPVSAKLAETLLVNFQKEKEAAEKEDKATLTATQELAVIDAEEKVTNAKRTHAQARIALELAKAEDPKGNHKALTDAIDKAKADLGLAQADLKALKKNKK